MLKRLLSMEVSNCYSTRCIRVAWNPEFADDSSLLPVLLIIYNSRFTFINIFTFIRGRREFSVCLKSENALKSEKRACNDEIVIGFSRYITAHRRTLATRTIFERRSKFGIGDNIIAFLALLQEYGVYLR